MSRRYSIAEARDRLAKVVHEVERGPPVELTRRGEPVAVLVGFHDYQRLLKSSITFSQALENFRKSVDAASLGIDPEIFSSVATIADDAGRFSIANVPLGSYKLSFTFEGRTVEQALEVTGARTDVKAVP